MREVNELCGVVTTYSFDDTVQLRLFCSEREAKDFLKKDFLEERRIDEEENGWDTFCDHSDDYSFASITNRFEGRDDVTKWHLIPASAVFTNLGYNAATLAALRDMMRTFLDDAPRQYFEDRPDEEEALETLQSAWEESACLLIDADGDAEPDEDEEELARWREACPNGYGVFVSNSVMSGDVEYIARVDALDMFHDDDEAAAQAEKDGVKLIHDLPEGLDLDIDDAGRNYVDTPENRARIRAFLKEFYGFDWK